MRLVPIIITEEILGDTSEFAITADGSLDLDSGDITIKEYYILEKDEDENILSKEPYDVEKHGLPCLHKEYDFSSGLLKIQAKELEFAVNVDQDTGVYEVSADELEEIKQKALALASATSPAKKTKKSK